jgi:hypothetical protein
MVAITDMPHVNALTDEKTRVEEALYAFDHDGKITSMTVMNPENRGAAIPTGDLHYPQQMVQVIKHELNERLEHIVAELTGLGVTELPEPMPRATKRK